jgi:hypothetical protein
MLKETKTIAAFREEIRQLAEEAFHKHLISGYGDGEDVNKYQIVIEGKPRHYSLEHTYSLLCDLLGKSDARS